MKCLLQIIWVALLLPLFSSAQSVVLYRETFPYAGITGNFPVSTVGWANDIPDGPSRLFQNSGGDGAVFAFENTSATTAFYTSTTLTRMAGATFPSINPLLYSGLTLSVDIQPTQTPANITARFAVQMNGAAWFAAANVLPVPGTAGSYATYSSAFNPSATQWDSLSVSGNGTATHATIGSVISTNLSGNITGAGLVFVHTGSGGTFNFDNFLITATNAGTLTINSNVNGAVAIAWPGAMNVYVQSSTNLNGGHLEQCSFDGGAVFGKHVCERVWCFLPADGIPIRHVVGRRF